MNYIVELNAFNSWLDINCLSTGQIALWYALMQFNNRANWSEWFIVPSIMLEIHTGLSRTGMIKARNALKQLGIIDFQSQGTKAGKYKMHSIATMLNSEQRSEQGSEQVSEQSSEQGSEQASEQNRVPYININNKHRHKHKENSLTGVKEKSPSKHKYGEYKNVFLTDEEYSKLQGEYSTDFEDRIERLSAYMASTGKSYKNHLATIRNWDRMDKLRGSPVQEKQKSEYESFMADLASMRE